MAPFEILSTLGPASLRPDFIRLCLELGVPRFRLNGSHLSVAQLEEALRVVRDVATAAVSGVCLDLQGGKRRIGRLVAPRHTRTGDVVVLVLGGAAAGPDIPVPHPEVFQAAAVGDRLVLQDGQARLRVEETTSDRIRARVELGAVLRSGCGLHVEGKSLLLGRLPGEQTAQISTAAEHGVGQLALSYAQQAGDLAMLRQHCAALGYAPGIVAKIERPEALQALPAICEEADEVWVCRGDLGSLIPLRELGAVQDRTIRQAVAAGTPALVAGQVFHHLTEHSQPTRSEVVHLHAVREQGAAGIVLSDETAIGRDPMSALRTVVSLL